MNTRKQEGFTIIEVVLVLAIAGLIFLMVFIALPALQRNQRDTERRGNVGRVLTAVQNYQTNSKGNVPTTGAQVFSYLVPAGSTDTFDDPSSGPLAAVNIVTNAGNTAGAVSVLGNIYYNVGRSCDSANAGNLVNAGARKVAVRTLLEGGGVYCAGN